MQEKLEKYNLPNGKNMSKYVHVKLPINAIGFHCENFHKIYGENSTIFKTMS